MTDTPRWALDIINEVREKRLPELDLSLLYSRAALVPLTHIPVEIQALDWLESLDVSHNHIETLPEWLCDLNLTSLDVGANPLGNLPEWMRSLTNLTVLHVWRNNFNSIPEWMRELTNLEVLNIGGNKLMSLPRWLCELSNLKEFWIGSNSLGALPEWLHELRNLTHLNVRRNNLTRLPESLHDLKDLTELLLDDNELTSLPEWLSNLHSLTSLSVACNKLRVIPEWLVHLPNLEQLSVYRMVIRKAENPLETPPPEVARRGLKAIRDYYRQRREQGVDYLYEAKLLIVGEGGAGKTTLANTIQTPGYAIGGEESTKGIVVSPWKFKLADGKEFRVNIWDFGGQEIYKSTHQFFLTKRSLYVLLADDRKQDTDFQYWLKTIELWGEESPAIVAKNEREGHRRQMNNTRLMADFRCLRAVLDINLKTGEGVRTLIAAIEEHISRLPHVGNALPANWVKVRKALERRRKTKNYISVEEYLQICQKQSFTNVPDALQLSEYLHDLGVCLHFQEDQLLSRVVILNPEWGTQAVYKLLDHRIVQEQQGFFTWKDLSQIWPEEEYVGMYNELLQLMMNFQLCYEIPDHRGTFVAPERLADDTPYYEWDTADNLHLRYTYPDYMPKGILTRFIVAAHSLIEVHDGQQLVWKTGVVLVNDDTRAEVSEHYSQRRIQIRVTGRHRKELLTIVMYELDKIHAAFHRLNYDRLIPCNCATCQRLDVPHFYKYQTLQRYIEAGQYVKCDESFHEIDPRGLLDEIVDMKTIKQVEYEQARAGDTYNYYGDYVEQDKVINQGLSAQDLANLMRVFADIRAEMEAQHLADSQVLQLVGAIEAEAKKGDNADEAELETRMGTLAAASLDAFDVVSAGLAHPALGVAAIVWKVAQRARSEYLKLKGRQ